MTQLDALKARGIGRLVAIPTVVLSVALSCQPVTVIKNAMVSPAGDRPECPHTPEFVIKTVGEPDDDDEAPDTVRTILQAVPLSGPITDIPEFHDCQRFIVRDSAGQDVYDSLYAIYASDSLAFVDTILDTLAAGIGDTAAVAAATIYSYGGTYRPLGIEPGFNCLYLSRDDSVWRAWMLPKGHDDPNCSRYDFAISDSASVTRLVAMPRQEGKYEEDYPPVARWDWDATDGEQYLGIKCGDAWCEVSDDGTVSPQSVSEDIEFDDPPEGIEAARVRLVKGWYDAQRLAGRGLDGRLVPSRSWGVIVPHPTLQKQTLAMYQNEWVHVATMMVSEDYDGVVLSLKRGRQHKIYLCNGCAIPTPHPACQIRSGEGRLWSRITYKRWWGQVSVYGCMVRRAHTSSNSSPPDIPGTARWRWLAYDETTWTRCDHGCCELQ